MTGTRQRLAAGFTLIELLIAITVLGILSMAAVNSWRAEQLMAGRQLAAVCLLEAHQRLENLQARLGRHPAAGAGLSMVGYAGNLPSCDDDGLYQLELSAAGAPGRYRLAALARGRQAADGDLLLEVAPDHPNPEQRLKKQHRQPNGRVLPGWSFRPGSR